MIHKNRFSRDLLSLTKPRVTFLVIGTTLAGFFLAPQSSLLTLLWALTGTTLLVAAANSLNMYLERDVDAMMSRTMNRPLPARRLPPPAALWFGLSLSVLSLILLQWKINALTTLLGLIAFISYLLFYTPLKQRSHVALLVGAVPGAIPPLMGWTAATGHVGTGGLVLFFILFLWQIPHFLAIALMRKEEYEKAGLRVLPVEKGEAETRRWMVRYLAGLVAVSLYPYSLQLAGRFYLASALLLGLLFLALGIIGLKKSADLRWARRFFLYSIIYLPLLLSSLFLPI